MPPIDPVTTPTIRLERCFRLRAAAFVLGFTAVFTLLGLFAGTLGSFLTKYHTAVGIVCGAAVIVFGLSYLEVIRLPFFKGMSGGKSVTGVVSAFLFGAIYSVSLTPCVGAFLGSAIMLASASNAIIVGFNVRPDSNAKKIAENEGVQIRLYQVIYDMLDDVKAAMEGMLAPELREHTLGQAEIREIFRVPKVGNIAGCRVTEGLIRRSAKVRLIRDGVVFWSGELSSLKHFKDDVREIKAGNECGLSFEKFQDFRVGDVIEAYEILKEKKSLD